MDPIPKHQAPIETNHKKLQHLPLRVAQNHDAKHLSDQPQLNDTVDGSEIRLSPVEVGSLSYLRRVSVTSLVVVWDFLTINSTILPTWNEFHQGTPLIEPSLTSLLHPFAGTKSMRNVSAKPVPGTHGSGRDGCTPVEQLPGPNLSSWWFQPIWKRWSSILDHFHRERGENSKKNSWNRHLVIVVFFKWSPCLEMPPFLKSFLLWDVVSVEFICPFWKALEKPWNVFL